MHEIIKQFKIKRTHEKDSSTIIIHLSLLNHAYSGTNQLLLIVTKYY